MIFLILFFLFSKISHSVSVVSSSDNVSLTDKQQFGEVEQKQVLEQSKVETSKEQSKVEPEHADNWVKPITFPVKVSSRRPLISLVSKLGLQNGKPKENAANPDGSSTEALVPKNDILFTAQVTIGNGQTFEMNLDTGSTDTWIRGPDCKSTDDSCVGKSLDLSDSSISPLPGDNDFAFAYGLGNCSGKLYNVPMSMSGKTVVIPIGVTSTASHMSGSDGLLGLAFESLSQITKKTNRSAAFFDALGFPPEQNMFGFYMSNGFQGDLGSVTLGGYDTTKTTGPISWIPVTRSSYWEFDISQSTVSVGGTTPLSAMKLTATASLKGGIADTGTTQIILPQDVAKAINQAIGAGEGGTLPCTRRQTGPDVIFNINNVNFAVPATAYIRQDADPSDKVNCHSGFSGGAERMGFAIFGAAMNRAWYTIYDKSNPQAPRVGMVKAVHPGDVFLGPTPPSSSTNIAPTRGIGGGKFNAAEEGQKQKKMSSSEISVTIMLSSFGAALLFLGLGVYWRLKKENRLHDLVLFKKVPSQQNPYTNSNPHALAKTSSRESTLGRRRSHVAPSGVLATKESFADSDATMSMNRSASVRASIAPAAGLVASLTSLFESGGGGKEQQQQLGRQRSKSVTFADLESSDIESIYEGHAKQGSNMLSALTIPKIPNIFGGGKPTTPKSTTPVLDLPALGDLSDFSDVLKGLDTVMAENNGIKRKNSLFQRRNSKVSNPFKKFMKK